MKNQITDQQNLQLQAVLESTNWQSSQQLDSSGNGALKRVETALDWLLEMGSMTKRIESLGKQVSVVPHQERFITKQDNALIAQFFADEARYWLRDITLYADNHPWLIARTLIPETTLQDENQQLVDLGTIPLGRYLFSHPKLSRDFIEVGCVTNPYAIEEQSLWARRSLLRINDKPLLLSELFLPNSALY